jgi:RNA polymerase sigma factor (sigma-70 family)
MSDNKENIPDDFSHLSPKAKEDYLLITSALEGNQAAFENLLKKYKHSLYATILKVVKSKDVAEDIMIETFAKAFSKLNEYNPKYAFSTWLFRIGINKAIDYLRNEKKMPTSSIDEFMTNETETTFAEQLISSTNDPIQELLKEEKIAFVKLIIEKLNPRYKKIIELFYYQELSCEEIAKELGTSANAIKNDLFKARKILYRIIITLKHDK